jgi:dienelactone hydrolase
MMRRGPSSNCTTAAVRAVGLALLLVSHAEARIVEERLDLPVQVNDAYGKAIAQTIKLTVFRDDAAAGPQPLLVINHGRAADPQDRAALGRARYTENSRWFVQQGFVVAVPTRIGYGESGGEDVEDSGPCSDKRYPPGYAAAAQQTVQVLAAMREHKQVRKDRIVVLGQSYGGATAVSVAALNPPGVVAAINFAGGGGGNPKTQPGRPCGPHLLERMFADYGKAAVVPMLWIYAENDKYFGASYPKEWFEAFRKAGGTAEFVQFPAWGEDGHSLFTAFPAVWRPTVVEFLRKQGFEMKEAKETTK